MIRRELRDVLAWNIFPGEIAGWMFHNTVMAENSKFRFGGWVKTLAINTADGCCMR